MAFYRGQAVDYQSNTGFWQIVVQAAEKKKAARMILSELRRVGRSDLAEKFDPKADVDLLPGMFGVILVDVQKVPYAERKEESEQPRDASEPV